MIRLFIHDLLTYWILLQVKRNCGAARYAEAEDPTSIEINTEGNMIKQRNFPQLPDHQINIFLASIAQTKNFYDNLAEVMCKDESYAEPKDRRCWNGERIGEWVQSILLYCSNANCTEFINNDFSAYNSFSKAELANYRSRS